MNIPYYIIKKYVSLCNFEGLVESHQKFNMRCPLCGDSKKKRKKRGWILTKANQVTFWCFNCGASLSFYNYLKKYKPVLFDQYKQELLKEGLLVNRFHGKRRQTTEEIKEEILPPTANISVLSSLQKVTDNMDAVRYCSGRRFMKKFVDGLFYTDNFMKFLHDNNLKTFEKIPEYDRRIVIPFYSKDKTLCYIQGRTIDNNELRYMTIVIDKKYPKIWGLDKIDLTKNVYMFEGVIDAQYFDNSLALGGLQSNFEYIKNNFNKDKTIFLPDGDYRKNESVRNQITKYIEAGFKICFLPKDIPYKDINEMIVNDMKISTVRKMIDSNVFYGINAKLRLKLYDRL